MRRARDGFERKKGKERTRLEVVGREGSDEARERGRKEGRMNSARLDFAFHSFIIFLIASVRVKKKKWRVYKSSTELTSRSIHPTIPTRT